MIIPGSGGVRSSWLSWGGGALPKPSWGLEERKVPVFGARF